MGSGNFTLPGLTQNIELNVHPNKDQAPQLRQWFEEVWLEAVRDNITDDLLAELTRQIQLYGPYAIYRKGLLAYGDYVQGRESIPTVHKGVRLGLMTMELWPLPPLSPASSIRRD